MNALWITLMVLAAIAALWLFMIAPGRGARRARLAPLYAHRGMFSAAEGVCENTLPAFEAAIRAGVGIELDVQLTKDGEAVVFHDETFLRLLGDRARVSERTLAEIEEIRLPGGEPIPTFRQALDAIAGRAPLLIEVKPYNRPLKTAQKALETMRDRDGAWADGGCAIESFHPAIVRYFRKSAPGVPCGQLVSPRGKVALFLRLCMRSLILNAWSRPHFIAYPLPGGLAPRLFRRVFGAPVACWTVRSEADWRYAAAFDAAIFEGEAPRRG